MPHVWHGGRTRATSENSGDFGSRLLRQDEARVGKNSREPRGTERGLPKPPDCPSTTPRAQKPAPGSFSGTVGALKKAVRSLRCNACRVTESSGELFDKACRVSWGSREGRIGLTMLSFRDAIDDAQAETLARYVKELAARRGG